MLNRIITKGMGKSRDLTGRAGMITQGYGGFSVLLQAAIEATRNVLIKGRSSYKHAKKEIIEIVISARLLRVNGLQPNFSVFGKISVALDAIKNFSVSLVEIVGQIKKNVIKVFVKRL